MSTLPQFAISAAALALLGLFALPSAHAGTYTLNGETADRTIGDGNTTKANLQTLGYYNDYQLEGVFVFQLPALLPGQAIASSSLTGYLSSTTGTTGDNLYYNVDLRALDARSSSKVLESDYYQAGDKTHAATGDPGILIQSAFVQNAYGYGDPFNGGTNTPSNVFVTTNTTGSANLTQYLNTQDAALPNGFIFLRLTPDSYPNVGTSGVEFSSTDNPNISQRPVIKYTLTSAAAVPEASTQISFAVLLALGLLGGIWKARKQV